ncbi:MAG: prevent-host-death family protein [Acidobacteria bacterium]|nr:prevent-host-death family protein [Acidobacteriota bacterium]
MRRLNLDKDIKPVSEFRANAAELIAQVKSSGRPLVLTQRGQSTAVLLDVSEYDDMVEEIELLRDVRAAITELDAGKGMTNREAKAELRRRLGR